jgi:hypothetical protein
MPKCTIGFDRQFGYCFLSRGKLFNDRIRANAASPFSAPMHPVLPHCESLKYLDIPLRYRLFNEVSTLKIGNVFWREP